MKISSIMIIISLIIVLAFVAGAILLQIFLSKKKNKWFGLILPAICLSLSLIVVLANTAMYTTGELKLQQFAPDGTVISEAIVTPEPIGDNQSPVLQIVVVFALYNIPTAILLAIYFACRGKMGRKEQLEKMNIQDLE